MTHVIEIDVTGICFRFNLLGNADPVFPEFMEYFCKKGVFELTIS